VKRIKLSPEQRETARQLVGKTIKSVAMYPFDDGGYSSSTEPPTGPVITFTDGTCLRFVVHETETEYGVALICPARKRDE